MGTARLTPSFETHRGSRTRDRPPARQAHRTGWSDGTRCESAAALGRPAPIKKTRGGVRCRFRSWTSPDPWRRFSQGKRSRRTPGRCCWRRCVRRCWLSRRVCSLASAGNVCWAKPNHGFFECQQLRAKFFAARRRRCASMRAQAGDGDRCATATRIAFACMHRHESEHWSGFRTQWRNFHHARRTPSSARTRHACSTIDHPHRLAHADPDFAPHKRTCAKNARTPTSSTAPRGRDPSAGNERPAVATPRVFAGNRRRRISARLLPAPRRNRPDPAAR